MKNGIFQNMTKIVCPRFKMEYSKNFKQKVCPKGAKVEPGQDFFPTIHLQLAATLFQLGDFLFPVLEVVYTC